MSQSVNRAIIIGHLGRDPDLAARREGEGKIASFGVATSETWTDRASGERREKTQWHCVVSFNDHLSAVIERRCQKGTLVYVEGHLETRKWTDQQGQDRYVTEIIIDRFDGNLKVLANGQWPMAEARAMDVLMKSVPRGALHSAPFLPQLPTRRTWMTKFRFRPRGVPGRQRPGALCPFREKKLQFPPRQFPS